MYLSGAHAAAWEGRETERRRDARLLAPHMEGLGPAQAELLLFAVVGLTGIWARRRDLDDRLLLQAVTALRKTRDLDFATRADAGTMLLVLNEVAASAGGPAHVLGPRSMRLGPVSVSCTIEPGDLSGMKELYDRLLDSRRSLRLRRGAQADEVPTIGLPELVATKLTRRGDKAKDILDVTQLLAALADTGRHLKIERVRELIGERPDALNLLDELARRVEGEP